MASNVEGTRRDPFSLSQAVPASSQDAIASKANAQAKVAQSTNISLAISSLSSQVSGLAVSARSERPEEPPQWVPRAIIELQTRPDPEVPVQTSFQRAMLDGFKTRGRYGLQLKIYQEALNNHARNSSWYSIIEDKEKSIGHMHQLLMLLPDCIIVSLIKGTLPYDYWQGQDEELKSFVDHYMTPRSDYVAIYVNISTNARPPGYKAVHSTIADNAGKWLSANQVKKMLQRVDTYRKNDGQDMVENSSIDWHLKGVPKVSMERKHTGRPENMDAWQSALKKQYCTNVPPADADRPFLRCLQEVGFSIHGMQRLKEHIENEKTTTLFGLVNSITRQKSAQGGFEFGKPWQLILFPLWKKDDQLARVGEVLGSILCSSYWFWGGMNIELAGYSLFKKQGGPVCSNVLFTESLRATHKRLKDWKLVDLEWARLIRSDDNVDCLAGLHQAKQSFEDQEKRSSAVSQDLAATRKRLAKAKAEHDELRKAFEDQLSANRISRTTTSKHVEELLDAAQTIASALDKKKEVNDAVRERLRMGKSNTNTMHEPEVTARLELLEKKYKANMKKMKQERLKHSDESS